jgi:hypothetical protein
MVSICTVTVTAADFVATIYMVELTASTVAAAAASKCQQRMFVCVVVEFSVKYLGQADMHVHISCTHFH